METGTAVLRLGMHSRALRENRLASLLFNERRNQNLVGQHRYRGGCRLGSPEDCPLLCPYAASNKHPSNATTARANLHRFSVRSSARYASKSGLKTPA